MDAQTFWNDVGSKKKFEDPLSLDQISKYIDSESLILEYGCGYGRLMNVLSENGYQNVIGFDCAPKMIQRGQEESPELNLNFIDKGQKLPLEDHSVDLVIMSTILCCVTNNYEQNQLIEEARRVLKKGAVLYLADFIISDHPRYTAKYQKGFEENEEWGIYRTDENVLVRHYSTKRIMELLKEFDIQWFEQYDFKTMNQNPARTFHLIAKKLS